MRFLIFILIGYVVYQLLRSKSRQVIDDKRPQASDTHKDPVCGIYVSDDDAVIGNLGGERIYFCSRDCLDKFQEQQLAHTNRQEGGGNK